MDPDLEPFLNRELTSRAGVRAVLACDGDALTFGELRIPLAELRVYVPDDLARSELVDCGDLVLLVGRPAREHHELYA